MKAYDSPQWLDLNTHTPSFSQSTHYNFYPNTKPTQNLVSNFQDQNLMVIPTQDVVLNNTDNMESTKKADS